jgi:hypothetical protein
LWEAVGAEQAGERDDPESGDSLGGLGVSVSYSFPEVNLRAKKTKPGESEILLASFF